MKPSRIAPVALIVLVAAALIYWKGRGKAPGGGHAPATASTPHAKPARPSPASGGGPRLEVDDDPAGSLRLEGQVIDADERPVAGARVIVSANPPREATSEGDGSFAFEGLLAREYDLEASAGAGYGGPVRVRLVKGSEPVILRLEPAGDVEITTLDAADRHPVAG